MLYMCLELSSLRNYVYVFIQYNCYLNDVKCKILLVSARAAKLNVCHVPEVFFFHMYSSLPCALLCI